jgi:hypothetical protein
MVVNWVYDRRDTVQREEKATSRRVTIGVAEQAAVERT